MSKNKLVRKNAVHRPSMGVARSRLWAPVPCQDFGESRFQSGVEIPSTSEFCVFPNPALYFAQIPDPESSLPDPVNS